MKNVQNSHPVLLNAINSDEPRLCNGQLSRSIGGLRTAQMWGIKEKTKMPVDQRIRSFRRCFTEMVKIAPACLAI